MGGGGGAGLFVGTIGGSEADTFPSGRLVAAAAQVNSATDVGGKPVNASSSSSGGLFEEIRPWWTLPYGHPEKIQRMEDLQRDLKPRLEGFAQGFIEGDKKDFKSWVITQGSKLLSRQLQKKRKKSKKD